MKLYGVTIEQYDKMLEEQGGVCRICELPSAKVLAVDHCHDTGKIRGLLCKECNQGLGSFKDKIQFLQNAINYLNNARA